MGVYIPDMKMPENCICCDLSHEDWWCPAKQDYVDRYSFETCPLVPVPPHGKLIDANKLIDRLQKQLNEAQAKVRAMGELNIGYTPDMYIVDRNRDMISILIAQAAFLPEEGTR